MKLKLWLGVLLILLFVFPIKAQDVNEMVENNKPASLSQVKIGLSARLTNFYLIDQIQSTISIPFIINKKIKIEPEFSYLSEKKDNPITGSFDDYSFFHIGVGASMIKQYTQGLLYIGIRGGFIKSLMNSESNGNSDYFAGPFIGYDHFLSENFAIGMDINPIFMKVDLKTVFKSNTSARLSFYF